MQTQTLPKIVSLAQASELRALREKVKALPDAPSPQVSDKYLFLDTKRVVDDMADLGYEVVSFRRPKFRTREGAFGTHEVSFRSREVLKEGPKVGEEHPQLVFLNAYDGSRRAQILSGLFRLVCSNGLMVGRAFQEEKFLHMTGAHTYENDLLEALRVASHVLDRMTKKVDGFKELELDRGAALRLAERAAELRFGDDKKTQVEPRVLLMPRRRGDAHKDLWTTWNVLQENLMQGGLPGSDETGNSRLTRPVNNIQASNTLNRGLWDLLEETAEEVQLQAV